MGNVADFLVVEEEDCVDGFCDARLALRQSMDFVTHHRDPEMILCDCLLGDRMYNTITVFLDVNDGTGPL